MLKAIEEVWERKSMPMTNWKHFDHHLFKKALCTFDQFSSLDLHHEDLILLCPTFDHLKINILTMCQISSQKNMGFMSNIFDL